MALTQVYSAVPNDVITAARWNNEFGNIYNNGTAIAFPVTQAVSFAGFTVTLDSSGQSTLTSSGTTGFLLAPGTKTGTPGTTGFGLNIAGQTATDSNTAGSGTAASATFTTFQRPTLAASNTVVACTDAATVYIANSPANGTNETITNPWSLWVDAGNVRLDGDVRVGGSLRVDASNLIGSILSCRPIGGLTYANSGGDNIVIAVGETVSDDATVASRRLMILGSALTKVITSTWAVGSGNGFLDTGAVGNSDYYIWLIQRADTGVVDALASLSSTAPNMPANYSFKRLIGWFKRVGGTNVAFTTYEMGGGGLELLWSTPTLDLDLSATLTTARRTDAVKVPLDVSTIALLNIQTSDAVNSMSYIYCPDQTDQAPSLTVTPLTTMFISSGTGVEFRQEIRTSSAGLIAARCITATCDNYRVVTLGFRWSRRT